MKIPFRFNPMGNDPSQDTPGGAVMNVRGCFTFLQNGRCNQSAMSMSSRTLRTGTIYSMAVSSEGDARKIRLYSGATIRVAGGSVSGIEVMSNATVRLEGGTATDIDLGSNGTIYQTQGLAQSVNIGQNGVLNMSGGTASGVEMTEERGNIYVSSGAVLYNAAMNRNSQYINISSGGTASGIQMSSGYSKYIGISSGGTARDIAIGSNMSFTVVGGADVSGITMGSSATLNVSQGAAALGINLASGANLAIYPGGETDTAFSIGGTGARGAFTGNGTHISNVPIRNGSIGNYGTMEDCQIYQNFVMMPGAQATRTTWGPYYSSAYGTVSSKCSAMDNQVQSNMRLWVINRGFASGNTIAQNATMFVSNASAHGNTVQSGGRLEAMQNAQLPDASGGGTVVIYQNAQAGQADLSGGVLSVFSYGTITSATLTASARAYVSNGGRIDSLNIDGGAVYLNSGHDVGAITVGTSGGTIAYPNERESLANTAYGDSVFLQIGYSANIQHLTLGDGGGFSMQYGGTATDISAGARASVRIESGCSVQGVAIGASGTYYENYCSGGGSLTVGNGGHLSVYQRTGSAQIGIGAGGHAEIYNANDASVMIGDSANFNLQNAGTAVAIGSGASGTICGNIYAVIGGGASVVMSYATLNMPNIGAGATVRGYYSGTIRNASIGEGAMLVAYGGYNYASNITVGAGAVMSVCSRNSATDVTVQSGGSLHCDGDRSWVSGVTSEAGAIITGNSITYKETP